MRTWVWIIILISGIYGLLNGLQVTGVGRSDSFVGPNPSVIPQDALRLRIIANSNSPTDQHVKREVRDRVINLIGERMQGVKTPQQAQTVLEHAVPEVEELAKVLVRQTGMHYSVSTSFGKAQFPTKLYGSRVYPAGIYSALRVTLGHGAGQNWWCVLFPPLCFVALSDGDAVAATKAFPDYPPLAVTYVTGANGKGRVPVDLRLAIVDYGEQYLKELIATFSSVVHL